MRLYIKALALLTSPYYVWYWFLLSMSWCQLAQTSKLTKVGELRVRAIVISLLFTNGLKRFDGIKEYEKHTYMCVYGFYQYG